MKMEFVSKCAIVSIGVAVMLAGVCAVSAQEAKATDPFVKGKRPAVVSTNAAAGESNEQIKAIMESIKIPEMEFRQADIHDVVAILQIFSVKYDPQKRGINFVLKETNTTPPITFSARGISLLETLNIVTKLAGLKYEVRDSVVYMFDAVEKNQGK